LSRFGSFDETAVAPALTFRLAPTGKQHTTSTMVAVTVAPEASAPPGAEQNVGSLHVIETKLNASGFCAIKYVSAEASGPRFVSVIVYVIVCPTATFGVP
jgi:hypothetical protein